MEVKKGEEEVREIVKEMPRWEKITWVLLVIYLIIVFVAYWYLGWRVLGFPL